VWDAVSVGSIRIYSAEKRRLERAIMVAHPPLSVLWRVDLWQGVLDVLVVAYLLYRLLLLVRGTRAMQILGGLGTLLSPSSSATNFTSIR